MPKPSTKLNILKMNHTLRFLAVLCVLVSCKESKDSQMVKGESPIPDKLLLSETEEQLEKYHQDSEVYWERNDMENAAKYEDSISNLITSSYLDEYTFLTLDSIKYNTIRKDKPLFMQVTASWCAPCMFEIPALNSVVEKYSDKVDFVLLFWDSRPELKVLAEKYTEAVRLVPAEKEQPRPNELEISGFRHKLGFPTNYLIARDNRVVSFSQGAMMPRIYEDENGKMVTVTEEEANQKNIERLESEIQELLKYKEGVEN